MMSKVGSSKLEALTAMDREILKSIRAIEFGSVEVTIHGGRVVQVERREKLRCKDTQASGTQPERPFVDRTSGDHN
jgi:hypothetical protein